MFADKEKMDNHQSYVERKHDFPGMVTSFFPSFYVFTVHPLSQSPERDNGNTLIKFLVSNRLLPVILVLFENKWKQVAQSRNNSDNLASFFSNFSYFDLVDSC